MLSGYAAECTIAGCVRLGKRAICPHIPPPYSRPRDARSGDRMTATSAGRTARRDRFRQRDRRRDRRGGRPAARAPRSGQGHHDPDRSRAQSGAVRARWGRRSRCPAAPAPTPWRRSPRSAPRWPTSARCRTISWARCSRTTSARPASSSGPARSSGGPPTARCLIFVTPDAQRTMATYLGACVELGPDDVDEAQVAAAEIGLPRRLSLGSPGAKAACLKAAEIAHRHGRAGRADPVRPVLRRPLARPSSRI